MLPVGIDQAWPNSSIEVWAMAGHTDLGVNLLPSLQVTGTGKGSNREADEKEREGM